MCLLSSNNWKGCDVLSYISIFQYWGLFNTRVNYSLNWSDLTYNMVYVVLSVTHVCIFINKSDIVISHTPYHGVSSVISKICVYIHHASDIMIWPWCKECYQLPLWYLKSLLKHVCTFIIKTDIVIWHTQSFK